MSRSSRQMLILVIVAIAVGLFVYQRQHAQVDTTGVPSATAAAGASGTSTGATTDEHGWVILPNGARLPNPVLTPGATLPVTKEQICVSGYSASVRSVPQSVHEQAFTLYHIAYPVPTGAYEVDHLISLELGGSNDITNLWPEPAEPRPGFHEKDTLENALHKAVCAGTLELATAQQMEARNWYAAYLTYVLHQ